MDQDVVAYKEQLEFERLSKKFSKTSIAPAPVPYVPPPERRPASRTPSIGETQRTEPVARPSASRTPSIGGTQAVASVNPQHDTSRNMIDYDRLIGGVADRMSRQNSQYAQLEKDIRADERKKADATYKEQMQSIQRRQSQAYGALSTGYKQNQVFDRSSKLRETYTQRYKNNWYSNY